MVPAADIYTPPQLAKRWKISPERVIRFILAGELAAMNLASDPNGCKPRYKISADAVEAFEAARTVARTTPARPRRRAKLASVREYF